MTDETKAKLYVFVLVIIFMYFAIAWYGAKSVCENSGGIYARGLFTWDCITVDNFRGKP